MRQNVPFVGDQADALISNFGGVAMPSLENAPIVGLLALSFNTAAATINLRLFYAPAAAAADENNIEIFNQAVTPGAIAGGIWVTIIGGQGGCQNVWCDETTQVPWTLRVTVVGLGGADAWNARVVWVKTRLVT